MAYLPSPVSLMTLSQAFLNEDFKYQYVTNIVSYTDKLDKIGWPDIKYLNHGINY